VPAPGVADLPGVVQGSCKKLVKDRMEWLGMRWTPTLAKVMLKLRAVYLLESVRCNRVPVSS
jgi:hypothetical protein